MTADLFEAGRHEPLDDVAWDERRVREAIRSIVADTEQAVRPDGTWPWHARDREDADEPPQKSLYLGAAGVLWALGYLRDEGAVGLRLRPEDRIDAVYRAYLDRPDTGEVVPSYFLGEAGILLVHWGRTHSDEAAQRLHDVVARNVDHPANEALWAAPGTMLAAVHMLRRTGEVRWRDLVLANADHLWRTWEPDARGLFLWTQHLYGHVMPLLGAAHGFAGNAYALLQAAPLLPADRQDALHERIVATLQATAVRAGGGVNWPPEALPPTERRRKMLMQWCHGAPGIVTALAGVPAGRSPAFDALLAQAGATVWRAGPLAKGPGVCHGTAGNGYAFLALYRRTGEAQWLDRARRFAMHAIAQSDLAQRAHGMRRYTLWTGDPGLAVYLWHCLRGEGGLPTLDVLDATTAGISPTVAASKVG